MLRFGTISEIFPATGCVRVKLEDEGDTFVTKPIPCVFQGTQDNKYYTPFRVNEYVAVMMDEHLDDGVCLGCLYTGEDAPAGTSADAVRVVFTDNTVVEYNFSTSVLTVDCAGEVVLKAADGLTIEADTTITGDVEITGDTVITGDVDITGDTSANGKIDATGVVKSLADVKAGPLEISLLTHKHVSAAPGSPTGPAIP